MMTEQAIGAVVFLALLAICIVGLLISTRQSERLDRSRHAQGGMQDPVPQQRF